MKKRCPVTNGKFYIIGHGISLGDLPISHESIRTGEMTHSGNRFISHEYQIDNVEVINQPTEPNKKSGGKLLDPSRAIEIWKALTVWIFLALIWPDISQSQSLSLDVSAPFSLAPAGHFGGAVVPEFDRRTLNDQLVYQRRATLRMGWSAYELISFWVEGGLASLQLFEDDHLLQGAYGPAAGVGGSYLWHEPVWNGWTPFGSARMTYLQSKLSDDQFSGSSVRSRRSRFEWIEYSGVFGGVRQMNWGDLQAGLSFRVLGQDEYRTSRTGSSSQKTHTTYSSGFQPGLAVGGNITLSRRMTLWLMAEISVSYQKITISFGQWGAP